jgi:hypothetical protein
MTSWFDAQGNLVAASGPEVKSFLSGLLEPPLDVSNRQPPTLNFGD